MRSLGCKNRNRKTNRTPLRLAFAPRTPDPGPPTQDPRAQSPEPRAQTSGPRSQASDPRPQTPDLEVDQTRQTAETRLHTPDCKPQNKDSYVKFPGARPQTLDSRLRPQAPEPRPQTPDPNPRLDQTGQTGKAILHIPNSKPHTANPRA